MCRYMHDMSQNPLPPLPLMASVSGITIACAPEPTHVVSSAIADTVIPPPAPSVSGIKIQGADFYMNLYAHSLCINNSILLTSPVYISITIII